MQKYSEQQYNEIFQKLPPEIKDAIASSDTINHITLVGKKHNLHIDKIGELVDLTYDVMMGIVGTKDFVAELQNTLQITALEASVLSRDIDENVFKPIKEIMIHLYAGRAPYKPSSSLVQFYEEDEEHPALSKENLLKEIEDPTPAEVKKHIVIAPQISKSTKPENTVIETKPTKTEITEYHEELKGETIKIKEKDVKVEAVKPSSIGAPAEEPALKTLETRPSSTTNILDQLASIKLSQSFVMPKGVEGIRELSNIETQNAELKKPLENLAENSGLNSKAAELKTIEETELKKESPKPVAKPETIVPQKPATRIDPYREPL